MINRSSDVEDQKRLRNWLWNSAISSPVQWATGRVLVWGNTKLYFSLFPCLYIQATPMESIEEPVGYRSLVAEPRMDGEYANVIDITF